MSQKTCHELGNHSADDGAGCQKTSKGDVRPFDDLEAPPATIVAAFLLSFVAKACFTDRKGVEE